MGYKKSKPQAIAFRHMKNKAPYCNYSVRLVNADVQDVKARGIELSSLLRELLSNAVKEMKESENE